MLQPCPECKADVSDAAEVCPHCGYRLIGRDALVFCPTCNANVLPVRHRRDTVSRYCPYCDRPLTNLLGRKVLLGCMILFMLAVVGTIVAGILGFGSLFR